MLTNFITLAKYLGSPITLIWQIIYNTKRKYTLTNLRPFTCIWFSAKNQPFSQKQYVSDKHKLTLLPFFSRGMYVKT